MSLLRQSIRSTASSLRLSSKCVYSQIILQNNKRFNSTVTETATTETTSTENIKQNVDPKITEIVESIAKLSLLETSVLITELKTKLNIPDMAFPAMGSIPAGGFGGAAAPGAGAAEAEAEPKEEAQVKTLFNVKLESFDAKSKPKIIKEVKALLGLSLVESKKFVESAPKVLKENLPKEDAEKMQQTLEGLGAKIVLE